MNGKAGYTYPNRNLEGHYEMRRAHGRQRDFKLIWACGELNHRLAFIADPAVGYFLSCGGRPAPPAAMSMPTNNV